MRKLLLLFAIVFVFSVLANIGKTQVERTLEQRVAVLEARVAQLESRFAEKPPAKTAVSEWSYIDEYGIKQPAVTADEIVLAKQQRYERLQTSEINRKRLLEWRKTRLEEKRQRRIDQGKTRRYPIICWGF